MSDEVLEEVNNEIQKAGLEIITRQSAEIRLAEIMKLADPTHRRVG